jgi:membrane associated rhomboid family serine protease
MNNFKDIPVCSFIAISLLIIFLLYFSTILKNIPCGYSLLTTFSRNFIHTDMYHLIGNLFSLYALSRVEYKIGIQKFILLLSFLLIFNSILEIILYKSFPSIKCSIGFSGILFGVFTWELITTKKVDIYLFISIISTIIIPSLTHSNISLSGHFIGAFSGILSGSIWKSFDKNNIYMNNKDV